MGSRAVQIDDLWKQYRLGVIGHGALYRDLQSWWARKRGKEDPNTPVGFRQADPVSGGDRFWALREIGLEIEHGETVGIIGKNGAGKSTLLKVLSRVTAPTRGEVRLNGRIASLLEVGTGFHPELTGRENIYLNGAILGMRKMEIDRKFDEIVDFSGVETFIDTPVKRYSSGMYVRLAFAVAAHLEPEILLVDEVLAVGDAEFQKKCLGKMGEVAREGRTVLFVSHNMAAVRNLCARSILLEDGRIAADGPSEDTVNRYLRTKTIEKAVADATEIDARMEGVILRNNPHIRFASIGLYDNKGQARKSFYSDEPIRIRTTFHCLLPVLDLKIMIEVTDNQDNSLIVSQQTDTVGLTKASERLEPGVYEANCTLPPNLFGSRSFYISVHLQCPKTEHLVATKILEFDVQFQGYNGSFNPGGSSLRPQLAWQLQNLTGKGGVDHAE
ncbi:MAG TPA: polysaccharide ABC transporter ATP-binding protein [Syntrophales bacterium]|jgi:lipopolysaccharide transport system ATP-binding protein|nr:polysaccharide ABC transporter ATP-binding protein [Syntrophales bacterium]